MMHDIIIKGGLIVDGTGKPPFVGDVAIDDGYISEVGSLTARGKREINADGLVVTPGFVDIHTHYDGQATWDPILSPSFHNGVTTVVMGNCGVGFAPVRPNQHKWLIGLMEGVEEIPGTALYEGMRWGWESFPEYLDALDSMPRAMDVGALIAHGALRAYVMGERAVSSSTATPQEVAEMSRLVSEAMKAGAVGFSTSRTSYHRSIDGELVPGTFADENELVSIANAIKSSGRGVMEVVPMGVAGEASDVHMQEIRFLRRIAERTGCPIQVLTNQYNERPEAWREVVAEAESAAKAGFSLRPQVFGRGTGVLFSFQSTNPFYRYPTYMALSKLPLAERKKALRDPEVRARILADHDPNDDERRRISENPWPRTYIMGENANWEPAPEESVAEIAKRAGLDPKAVGYDLMLERDCANFLIFPMHGYSHYNLEWVREALESPETLIGGSDAGAHVNTVCDGAMPTFMVTHWSRDRTRGPKIPLERIVQLQTSGTASSMGMFDRGLLQAGLLADINLIDYERLRMLPPEFVRDLPAGAGRLIQRAEGYRATLKSGVVIAEDGEETGERPGRVVRNTSYAS